MFFEWRGAYPLAQKAGKLGSVCDSESKVYWKTSVSSNRKKIVLLIIIFKQVYKRIFA